MVFRRSDQIALMSGKARRKTRKQGHVFGGVAAVFVFSVAIRRVHADAQDPWRVWQNHFVFKFGMRHSFACSNGFKLIQRAGANYI